MPSTNEIIAGGAVVKISADNTDLQPGLDAATSKFKAWGDAMREIGKGIFIGGTALTAALTAATVQFASLGSVAFEASERTGIAVETMSALGYAATQTGVSADALSTGVSHMAVSIYNLASGTPEATAQFRELGLSMADLKGLSPDQEMGLLADRLAAIESPTLRDALAVKVFGRNARELLPLLSQGSTGIAAFTSEAKNLGLVIGGEQAAAAERLERSLRTLWDVVKMGSFAIGADLAPALLRNVEALTGAIVGATKFVQAHKDLIEEISIGAAAITGLGAGIYAVGVALSGWGTIVGIVAPLGTAIAAVGAPLAAAALAVGGLGYLAEHGSLMAGTAFGDIRKAAGVAAAGIGNVFHAVFEYLRDGFDTLVSDGQGAYDGLRDALSGGDWGTAMKIGVTAVQLEWTRGLQQLETAWLNIKPILLGAWTDTLYGIGVAWHSAIDDIKEGWSKAGFYLREGWAETGFYFREGWAETVDLLEHAWSGLVANIKTVWLDAMHILMDAWIRVYHAVADKEPTWLGGSTRTLAQDQASNDASFAKAKADITGHRDTSNATADGDRDTEIAAAGTDRDKAIAAAKAKMDGQIAAARGELAEAEKRLAEEKKRADANAAKRDTTELDALEKRKKDLQEQLKQLESKAAGEAKHSPTLQKPKPFDPAADTDAYNGIGKGSRTIGMFGGDAGYGLGAVSTAQDRTARATEEIAKNTAALLNKNPDQISQSAREQNEQKHLTNALNSGGGLVGGALGGMLGGGLGAVGGAMLGGGAGGFLQSILGQNSTGAAASFDQMKLGLQYSKGTDPKSWGDVHAGGTSAIVAAIHQTNEYLQKLIRKPGAQFA